MTNIAEHFHDDVNFILLPKEPTADDRLEETLKQAELLRRENTDEADNLADRLAACEPNDRCNSAACPMCSVAAQRVMVAASLELWPNIPLTSCCVVTSKWQYSLGRLAKADLIAIMSDLEIWLEEAGFADLTAVGFVDLCHSIDVRTGREEWTSHVHFVAPADQCKELTERLGQQLPASNTIPVPVRCVQVKDPARLLHYIFKPRPTRVIRFADRSRKARPTEHWLKPAQSIEALLWLGDYDALDRVFLFNVELDGQTLRVAVGEGS